MSNEEKFVGFDFSTNPYEEEAQAKWGNDAVDESKAKAGKLSAADAEQFNQIYRELAAIRHLPPESDEAQAGIGKWYEYLNRIADYSPEAFSKLGEMYVEDERFTQSIDQFGAGLALFMRDAIAVFAHKQANW